MHASLRETLAIDHGTLFQISTWSVHWSVAPWGPYICPRKMRLIGAAELQKPLTGSHPEHVVPPHPAPRSLPYPTLLDRLSC